MMNIYCGLNKYGKKVKIKSLPKYNKLSQNKHLFKKNNIHFQIKNEYELEMMSIYYNALMNKEILLQIHQKLLNEYLGLWESMDYQQRQVLIYGELELILKDLPHFYIHDDLILFPFFSIEINHKYVYDYESLLLKKNLNLFKDFFLEIKCPTTLYGDLCYTGGFSDFILIKVHDDISYFYLEDFKAIYGFNRQNNEFEFKVIIVSKNQKVCLNFDQLNQIVDFIIDHDEQGLINYLVKQHCISSKVFTKLQKKYIGG